MAVYVKPYLKTSNIKPDGTAPVYLRLTIDRKSNLIHLGKFVEPAYWDAESNNPVKKGSGNSQKLNHFINQERNKIDRIVLDLENQDQPVTFEAILQLYKAEVVDFIEFARTEIELQKGKKATRTLKEHAYNLNKLERFQAKINIHSIDYTFLTRYEYYLRNSLGNQGNTIAGNFKTIRTFLQIAIKKKITKAYPFTGFSVRFKDGDREFLTIQELNMLYDCWEGQRLDASELNVLQYFLFSCYAGGLRYSDIKRLRYDKINGGVIRVKVMKTGEAVVVPLVSKALKLIPPVQFGRMLVFAEAFENRHTNVVLKELVKKVGIAKKITFHCARHTFATVSLTIGIPIEVVSKLLGHRDIKTTQIYAKIVDELKVKEMQKWEGV